MLFANAFYSFPGQILGVRVYVIQRLNKIVENDKKYAKSLKNKKTRQPQQESQHALMACPVQRRRLLSSASLLLTIFA